MAIDTLQEFVAEIEKCGELVRVKEPVRTRLEITEVADRCMKSPGGGPALLFERPLLPSGQVADQPVAINLFGSRRRISLAMGVDSLDAIGKRIAGLMDTKVPDGLLEKLKLLPRLAEIAKYP